MATVSNAIVRAHYQQAQKSGQADDDLLIRCGLLPENINSGQGRSDADAFGRWLSLHWQAMDDEAGGFLQQPVRSGAFAMSMHALISAGNLRRALLRCGRFYRLLNPQLAIQLQEKGEEAHLIIHLDPALHESETVFYDAMLVLWLRVASWLIGQPLLLDRVTLPFTAPEYQDEYVHMYGCDIYTRQPVCMAVFSHHYLALPIIRNPDDLPEFLSGAPANLLSAYRHDESLSARVLAEFDEQHLLGVLDQTHMAERLGMSAVTLRRQLKKEGHSFQQLKDQWRRKRAFLLLRHSDRSLEQISSELGFSELSAFSRAFKQWTGKPPGDVR